MDTRERIRLSLILEEMKDNEEAAARLGLKDVSRIKPEPEKEHNKGSYSME